MGINGPAALELRPYQEIAVKALVERKAFSLEDAPGLGKTECAIAALEQLKPRNALIVAPKKILMQWTERYAKYDLSAPITVKNESDLYGPGVRLVNYERLLRFKNAPYFEVIVLDEAHRIRNWKTRTARTLKSLHAGRKWALTATPVVNNLADLYSLFEFLDKTVLGCYRQFALEHLVFKELRVYNRVIRIISGGKNVNALNAKLAPYRLKRTHEMVVKDLPALDVINYKF